MSSRAPSSSCFLSATAASAANIPETPIGPHPGRALGRQGPAAHWPSTLNEAAAPVPARHRRNSWCVRRSRRGEQGWRAGGLVSVTGQHRPRPRRHRPRWDSRSALPPAPTALLVICATSPALSRDCRGGRLGPQSPLLAYAFKVLGPEPDVRGLSSSSRSANLTVPPTPRRDPNGGAVNRLHTNQGQESRGSTPRRALRPSAGNAPKGFGAEPVRAAVGPSHCDTTAAPRHPPQPRRPGATRCQRGPRAGGLRAGPGLGRGGPPGSAARGEDQSGSDPLPPSRPPSLPQPPERARPN